MEPLPKDAPDHAGVARQSFIPIGPNDHQLCPFKISNLTFSLTIPKKQALALWESPGGGNEISFFFFILLAWSEHVIF